MAASLPILRLFFAALFFTGHSAFGTDASGDPANGAAGVTVPSAFPLPQHFPAGEQAGPAAEKPHHGGGGEYRIFKNNVNADPELSAMMLMRLLGRLPPDKSLEFITRHYLDIAELVTRLDQTAGSGGAKSKSYDAITRGLAPFGINTEKNRHNPPGGHDRGRPRDEKKNTLDELVDARRTLRSGDHRRTEAVLKTLKESYPDNSGVQSAVAQYYIEIKNYDLADKTATDAIGLDPENPDAYKARALARISLQDRKGAIEDIKKAMDIDPQDESAKILSALVAGKNDMSSLKSLSSLEELRKTMDGYDVPGTVKPERNNSEARGNDGVYGSGTQSPDFIQFDSYLKTASSKNRLGDYESAVKYAGLAIEKNPANLYPYLERANANNFMGRYEEAIQDTTYVIGRDPSNAQALNMRAWALNRKGLSKDAENDANKAIGINPSYADAWFNRALAYEKQGNYQGMLEDFRQAAALNSAYGARFQDAVAQYSSRVPGFFHGAATAPAGQEAGKPDSGLPRFIVLLGFTLTGGLLVAMGLLHILASSREKVLAQGAGNHPGSLTPSVFYEGVASGKYKIERKIGEGGMGIVYEAVDQSLDRKVAIKKMNEEIKLDGREKHRFLEEARTVAMLRHPNIVEIHTIFEEDDNIYLVFEHVSGVTLDKMLRKEARLNFSAARRIFSEAAKALDYAHSKNVVHRDLKLSNIMISDENEVKVMDFGLARRALESLARVSSREVVGSPAYMPPEQDLGGFSKESDIYSLGICLYEVLTGELPFKGPDFHYQKERMLYQPASDAVPGLPAAVDGLIAKALAPEKSDRFQTAAEFRRVLLDIA